MNLESAARTLASVELAESLPKRWAHVQGVARQAVRAVPLFDREDGDVLVAVAFLHDVGYSPGLQRTGFHPIDGANVLADRGFPSKLCALVAHH